MPGQGGVGGVEPMEAAGGRDQVEMELVSRMVLPIYPLACPCFLRDVLVAVGSALCLIHSTSP